MFLSFNFIVLAILITCIFVGLDKLIAITLYIGIIFCSDILNKISDIIKEKAKISAISEEKAKIYNISNCLFSFIIWLAIASEIICLTNGHGLSVEDSFESKLFCICAYSVLYFYGLLAIRIIHLNKPIKTILPKAQWYRVLQYLAIYQLISGIYFIGVDSFGFDEELREKYLYVIFDYTILGLLGYLSILLIERLLDSVRILSSLLKGKTIKFEVPFFISLIGSTYSLKDSLIKTIELLSGVNLSKSEITKYIIYHVEPVTIIALIIFWLLSSVVIVPPDKEALFYRFGKISVNHSYKPGLHFKLPWPFERIVLYQPSLLKVLNIGFEPDSDQKHIIWTKSHAAKNFYLLVGDGVELIAVDCQLFYKVNDLYKYVTKMKNPSDYIKSLTYRYLTMNTVPKTFDAIMSQNRNILISELKSKIQNEVNKEDLGVTIVDIVFLAIHPPLEVADAYEDVISAQRDKQTFILKANSESIKEIYMKKAFANDDINKAKAYAETTLANAIGEASALERKIIGYNTDPDLEEFRLKLDSMLKMAKNKNLYVVDKTFMRQNDRIMLNLQN